MNKISEKSKKIYENNFNRIVKLVFKNKEPKNLLSERNIDKIIEYVDSTEFTANTKSHLLRSWKKIANLRGIEGDTTKLDNKVKEHNDNATYTPASKTENENRITMQYLEQRRDFYKNRIIEDEFSTADTYNLLLSLYTYLPPLRSEDFYNTVIKTDETDEDTDNYYDMDTQKLVINKYKTAKSHGKRVIDVPDALHETIKAFHDKTKSEYLICSTIKSKLTAVTVNQMFKRSLKKDVSCNMIRKCYISSNIDKGMTAEQRKKDAQIMGHSLNVQQMTYSRFSDILHPDTKDIGYLTRRHQQLSEQLTEVLKHIQEYHANIN